jgi:hypothetical protein
MRLCARGDKEKRFSSYLDQTYHEHHPRGRVCVSVDGERSEYFTTCQGLRQGDPLSPILLT